MSGGAELGRTADQSVMSMIPAEAGATAEATHRHAAELVAAGWERPGPTTR